MTPSNDPRELARILRFQQSLLKLAAQCQQPQPPAKGARSEPSRRLEQLVRKVRVQNG
jgi:hypothetical protein